MKDVKRLIIYLLCGLFLSCQTTKGVIKDFNRDEFTLNLSRHESIGNDLSIDLMIRNDKDYAIKIPAIYLYVVDETKGEMVNNWFSVIAENSERFNYSGIYLCAILDDKTKYITLIPGEERIVTINNLNKYYGIDEQKGEKLRIQYQGLLGDSNELVLTY